MTTLLTGRGLWYGHPRVFTLQEWDALCIQARQWGIQILHPKVADGGTLWYDGPSLEKLRSIAVNTYHLEVVPWMFCYGNQYGVIQREAEIAKIIGTTFGSVILDIEDAWSGHTDWAVQFGQLLRHQYGFAGRVYATVYCNPEQHPTPNEALNTWVDGFLPQVYFALWTPNTSAFAISYFLPEWQRIEADLKGKNQVLKPILPIISLENHVPLQEITNWLTTMHYYGYCGFWYDGEYPLYAETILKAPMPTWKTVQKPPIPPVKETPVPAIDQNLNVNELRFIWHLRSVDIPWNPADPITQLWQMAMQHHPEIPLGEPTGPVQSVHLEGQDALLQVFASGKKIVHFKLKGTTCFV